MEVWLDQSELRGGEAWDSSIRRQIKGCKLFVPVISASTQAGEEATTSCPRWCCTFENCPRLDVIVAPGGWGTRKELTNPIMLEWLRARAAEAETVTAVCTGSSYWVSPDFWTGCAQPLTGVRSTGCAIPFLW